MMKSLSILVADDHLINRNLANLVLSKMGHKVILVENGQQALERMENGHFDLVLMDVMMPVMSGPKSVRLRREYEANQKIAAMPFLMLTSMVDKEGSEYFEKCGASGCLLKPLEVERLSCELSRLGF